MTWSVIVNPHAGNGSAGRKWPAVKTALETAGISFNYQFTHSPTETILFSSHAVEQDLAGLAVMGGDGTLSTVASVLSSHHNGPVLAVIPCGSGNDWARNLDISSGNIEQVIKAMKDFRTIRMDTALAVWETGERAFLNSSGTGLDALVLNRALELRKRTGLHRLSYILALLFSSIHPPVYNGVFTCDGEAFHSGAYLTFTCGVGPYSGGGMLLSPSAVPDDGLVDGLCLQPMKFHNIAANACRIFDGTLTETKWARAARGRTIRLQRTDGQKINLELDGEPVDTGASRWLEIRSVPGSLRVVIPSRK